ncbi:hypothetical protein [Alkalihalobacillus deserti]|uniref:hypothetical protein n=1 Tax=Alkalihalobacillus deserti TaxID=2879466 RepID=UPI001D1564C1|nr:hypothetical protein [Alkalihalobacillus deserti]
MEWLYTVGIIVVLSLIVYFQWPIINPDQKKEKMTFMTLLIISLFLAVFLVFFPDTTSPMQVLEKIFRPLGKLLS